jgi:protein TonB
MLLHGLVILAGLWAPMLSSPRSLLNTTALPPTITGVLIPPSTVALQVATESAPSAQDMPSLVKNEPVEIPSVLPEAELPKPKKSKSAAKKGAFSKKKQPNTDAKFALPRAAAPALSSTPVAASATTSEALTLPRVDASQLNNPAPAYPPVSRRMREQGVVLLEVLIQATGQVGEVRIKRSSGFKRLDDAASKAVQRWRYLPATRGGTAIEYWYLQPIEFSLAN